MGLFGRKKEKAEETPERPLPSPSEKELSDIRREVLSQVSEKSIFPVLPSEPLARREIPRVESPRRELIGEAVAPRVETPREEPARPVHAPLFIKIDRYRNILNALGQVRTSMVMIRNSFSALSQLEHARMETLKILEQALDRVEKKIANLDSELVRPAGYVEPLHSGEYADAATIEATIADLRGQIEQLKSEIEQVE